MDKLLFSTDASAYYGTLRDNKMHRHFAVQLTIADQAKFICRLDNSHNPYEILLIDSGQPHQVDSQGHRIVILLLDPLSPTGCYLRNQREPTEPSPTIIENLFSLLENFGRDDSVQACLQQVFRLLKIREQQDWTLDDRVQGTLKRISESSVDGVSLDLLANAVSLSTSRLQHLFKSQTGVPITKYLMWERMKKSVAFVGSKQNLTSSAYEAGFADSAHMSREFKKMFGFSPYTTLKDSRNVQVYYDLPG